MLIFNASGVLAKINMPIETEFFNWLVPHEYKPGHTTKTAYKMTRAEAQQRFPGCEPVAGSREVRHLRAPGDPEPMWDWQRTPPA